MKEEAEGERAEDVGDGGSDDVADGEGGAVAGKGDYHDGELSE
jgi:hypothetical protein